ncbi:MAG: PP2C family protein-serine/threonine phosphatase [Treponema sp.]|nr:PP2C family protein-serine/threonine phosphatase [Treponema sp.]
MDEKKTKKKLQTSLLIAVEIFTIMLSVCLGIIGYKTYYNGMIQKYMDYEEAVLNLAANGIDWDAVEISIVSGKQDAAHKALSERLDFVKSNSEIDWLYMIEPLNDSDKDNMKYICTGNTAQDYASGMTNRLGDLSGTEFPAEVARQYLAFYKNSKPGEYWYYPNKTEWGSVFTTSIVIRNSIGRTLGVLSVDINMSDIDAMIRIYPLKLLFAGFVCAAVFILILILWLNRRLIHPLKSLQNSAVDFVSKASGDDVESLNFEDPNIKTQDEIQSLSNALVTMASDTKQYMQKLIHETAERERISADLNVAAQIQSDMLPHVFPQRDDIDLYASMNPAKEVGGDFYDFFFVDEDHLALVIADVSGKGVPASLFMVIAKTIIKNRALSGSVPSSAQILHDANNQLCEGNEAGLFVTAWLGILDLNTGIVTAANAGHEFPAVRQPGKNFELVQDKHGLVLAGFEGSTYTDYEIKLEKGATLFVYTDGVPEATNGANELFEFERMKVALNIKPDAEPKELLPIVRAEVDKFVGAAPQFDDLTMLAVRYKGR